MSCIRIEWLSDANDCDQCGGGYAEGAQVFIDGELALDLQPVATCFGSDGNWDMADVYRLILEHLGHTLSHNSPIVGSVG